MKGDSGPYVQYTAVRIGSLVQKAFKSGMSIPEDIALIKLSEDDRELLRILEGFFESLNNARQRYATSPIALYLLKLCHEYNKYYNTYNVINDKNVNGLVISIAVREVLELGLNLLGIGLPEKM